MRCLYCGAELAFLKRLTGTGEFCSDAHRKKFHEEFDELAVSRLLQVPQGGSRQEKEESPPESIAKPESGDSRLEASPLARRESKPVRPAPSTEAAATGPVRNKGETPVQPDTIRAQRIREAQTRDAAAASKRETAPSRTVAGAVPGTGPDRIATPPVAPPQPQDPEPPEPGFVIDPLVPRGGRAKPRSRTEMQVRSTPAGRATNFVLPQRNAPETLVRLPVAGWARWTLTVTAAKLAEAARITAASHREFRLTPFVQRLEVAGPKQRWPHAVSDPATIRPEVDVLFRRPQGVAELWRFPPLKLPVPRSSVSREAGNWARLDFSPLGAAKFRAARMGDLAAAGLAPTPALVTPDGVPEPAKDASPLAAEPGRPETIGTDTTPVAVNPGTNPVSVAHPESSQSGEVDLPPLRMPTSETDPGKAHEAPAGHSDPEIASVPSQDKLPLTVKWNAPREPVPSRTGAGAEPDGSLERFSKAVDAATHPSRSEEPDADRTPAGSAPRSTQSRAREAAPSSRQQSTAGLPRDSKSSEAVARRDTRAARRARQRPADILEAAQPKRTRAGTASSQAEQPLPKLRGESEHPRSQPVGPVPSGNPGTPSNQGVIPNPKKSDDPKKSDSIRSTSPAPLPDLDLALPKLNLSARNRFVRLPVVMKIGIVAVASILGSLLAYLLFVGPEGQSALHPGRVPAFLTSPSQEWASVVEAGSGWLPERAGDTNVRGGTA